MTYTATMTSKSSKMTLKEVHNSMLNGVKEPDDELIQFIEERFEGILYVQDNICMWSVYLSIILGLAIIIYFV